jgi:hypothetical protein
MPRVNIFKKLSPIKMGFEGHLIYDDDGVVLGARMCKRVYVCLPGRRLIFRDGVYEGWYKP